MSLIFEIDEEFTVEEFKALLEDNGGSQWRPEEGSSKIWRIEGESSFSDRAQLADKFISVFQKMASNHYFRADIIQFWVPRVVGWRLHHLSTWDQPFYVQGGLCKGVCEYRKLCMGYDYLVKEDDKESWGPIARVFRSGIPEWSPDVRLYSEKEHPLRDAAARCGFRGGYAAVPVFYDLCGNNNNNNNNKPVAVLECVTRCDWSLFESYYCFKLVKEALEAGGFTTTLSIPKPVLDLLPQENYFTEIFELAMNSVPELHLAQLWVPSHLSINNAITNNFMCMARSVFWVADDIEANSINYTDERMDGFLNACRFQKGQSNIGIAGLQRLPTNSSFFCRNIGDLSISAYPLAHYAQRARLSFCFAVCLRNKEDGNKTCVIEFFLQFDSKQDRNPFPILKFLLQIIDIKLKGYELSSGQGIGTEVPFEVSTENNLLIPFDLSQYTQNTDPSNSNELTMITKMIEWNVGISISTIIKEYRKKVQVFVYDYFGVGEDEGEEEEEDEEEEPEIWQCLNEQRGWKRWKIGDGEESGAFIFSRLDWPSVDNSLISSVDEIQHKITLLLSIIVSKLHAPYRPYLIQFWTVKQSRDKSHLVTKDHSFALNNPAKGLWEYIQWSMDHKYLVSEGATEEELGPPGRVFRSKYPECTRNLQVYSTKEFPLRGYAIQCGLRCYMAFPMVLLNQNQCVGVLEFISSGAVDIEDDSEERAHIFETIKSSFEEATLRATHITSEQSVPNACDEAFNEVEQMTSLAANIPQLGKVYLWVQCNDECDNKNCMQLILENHPSAWFTGNKSHKVISKKGIIGALLASENKSCFFANLCDFNIAEEQGILEARESRQNVCFAICLKSSYTGDNLYVFEFFLDQSCKRSENLCKFLSYLLPLMKDKLKSFKVASGREFEEELVIEVITFGNITKFGLLEPQEVSMPPIRFKISKYGEDRDDANLSNKRRRRNKEASINVTLQDLEPHFGKTLDVVSKDLGVSRSTIKRICRENSIQRWPSNPNNKGNIALFRKPTSNDNLLSSKRQDFHGNSSKNPPPTASPLHSLDTSTRECSQNVTKLSEEDVFIITAKFNEDRAKIQLNISSKMEKLNQEVMRRFNIEAGSFKLKYLEDDNGLTLLVCDDDLHLCLKNLKASEDSKQQSKCKRDVVQQYSLIVFVECERDNQHPKNNNDGFEAPKSNQEDQPRRKEVSSEIPILIDVDESDAGNANVNVASTNDQVLIIKYHGCKDYAGRYLLNAADQQNIDAFIDGASRGVNIFSRVFDIRPSNLIDLLFNNALCGDVINLYLGILCSADYMKQHDISKRIAYLSTFTTANILSLAEDDYTKCPETLDEYKLFINRMTNSSRNDMHGMCGHIKSGIRYITVPMNKSFHWYMHIVDLQEKEIYVLNSWWKPEFEAVQKWVGNFLIGWFKCLNLEMKTQVEITSCRQQDPNSLDCGVFISLWSECFLRDSPKFWFEAADMNIKWYRAQMACKILKHNHSVSQFLPPTINE